MKRSIAALTLILLLTPVAGFSASKEEQEMQRDIAQLQDQVRTLQSGFDQQMAAIKALLEQALDVSNKNSSSVAVLSSSIAQTLDRELKGALQPIAGLTAKIDNANSDISDIKGQMADLTSQINKLQQQLTDLNNAVKVIQAPQAAPPPPGDSTPGFPGTAAAAQPSARDLWTGASNDYTSGKADLAAGEFAEFLKLYPEDPQAADAQFYIGQIHYGQQKYEQAAMDFDAVLERFGENSRTPAASFMKGMALRSAGMRDAAITVWRTLIRKYPKSDAATQAREQLRALGVSPTTTTRRRPG